MHSRNLYRRPCRAWVQLVFGLVLVATGPWVRTGIAAETRFQGEIRHDQLWLKENGPYRLTGDVTIGSGVTVTIPPGTAVRFDKGSRILVKGVLAAEKAFFDGLAEMHDQETILFQPGSRGRLANCVVQNLALQIRSSDALITHSLISNRNGSGITVGRHSQPTITWNDFHRNSYYAIYNEGNDTITAPNNYWGAPDGPSGAGSGRGNAVNPTVDFRPFQTADIGEHLVLVDRRLESATLQSGNHLTLTYVIENFNSYDHAVILGATIYKDPENHIHSPSHDLKVAIQPGRHEFTRPFALPIDVTEGDYDVLWGIMKTDLTAYYVLEKDLGILHVMAELPPRHEPVAAPGWVPLKTMPY